MNKKEVRQHKKEERRQLSFEEIEEKSIAIANQLLQLNIWESTYFHLFLPIEEQKEVNSEYILQILQGKDKEIVVSKSDFATTTMTHFLLTDNTKIKKSQYNIPEPVDGIEVPVTKLEVVFVPLLAYDLVGNRVGYGKGFYDVFLSQCNPKVIKIGLSFFAPEKEIITVSATDIKLDFCITPTDIYRF